MTGPERYCFRKARYPSRAAANRTRRKAEAARGVELKVYPCPHCYGYHLAKERPEPRQAVQAERRALQTSREAELAAEAVAAAQTHGGRLELARKGWWGGASGRKPLVRSKAVRHAARAGLLALEGYTVARMVEGR